MMKITVAIPTIAGRGKYLVSALETCISQPDDNLEILVSDNSPGEAEELVRSFKDPRIRYIRPTKFLSMSAHWEFALNSVDSDVVSFIGDDDGLMPGCISSLSQIYAEHGNVPVHHSLCNYFWPDYLGKDVRNSISFFHDADSVDTWKNSSDYLKSCAVNQQRYVDGPMIYHNFIPVSVTKSMSQKGAFFRRAIPDVYSSFAIAANTEKYFSSGRFLTLSGTGAKSNGAIVIAGTSGADSFFEKSEKSPLYVGRFESKAISMLVLDSLLEVAEHFSVPGLSEAIDSSAFLASALDEGWGMAYRRKKEMVELIKFSISQKSFLKLLEASGSKISQRIARTFQKGRSNRTTVESRWPQNMKLGPEVQNIYQASLKLTEILNSKKIAAA